MAALSGLPLQPKARIAKRNHASWVLVVIRDTREKGQSGSTPEVTKYDPIEERAKSEWVSEYKVLSENLTRRVSEGCFAHLPRLRFGLGWIAAGFRRSLG
jgi:hypothetical protein